jgi:N-acetylneuraminic acid mutarotase/PKD repeat protein/RNA polymerase subunit RPABC4/transcription elongation factor Spt4
MTSTYSKFIFLLLVCSFVVTSIQPVFAQLWIMKSSMPTARSQAAVVLGSYGLIYVIGGFTTASGDSLTTVESYDPRTNAWSTKAPLPTATRGAAATVGVDGKIYVFGGVAAWSPLSATQIYEPLTDTWTTGASMPITQWAAGAAAAPNGKIYVMGGESDPNAVQIYTPTTNTWSSGAPMPSARREHVVVLGPDGLIYAIGGMDLSSTLILPVEAYNPNTNTWITKAPLPVGRCWMGVTTGLTTTYVIGGGDGASYINTNEEASRLDPEKIYVFGGGTQYSNNAPPVYRSTYVYKPSTDTWTTGASMATARREHGAATLPVFFAQHDIAVTEVTYPPTCTVGDVISIEVAVENQGDFVSEDFDVTITYNDTKIETKSVLDLARGASQGVAFSWNTSLIQPGTYMMKAMAETAFDEGETDNNLLVGSGPLTIAKRSSSLSISLSSASAIVGDTVTIEGVLSPAFPSVPIVIQWRSSGGSWNTLTTVNTNATGGYAAAWAPDAVGDFEVKAAWQGDDFTQTSESTVQAMSAVPENTPPVADASGPYTGTAGAAIAFNAGQSGDADGTIVEYRWNFGDGSGYAYSQNPSHTYTTVGTYTVSLQVTDDEGATATDTTQCTVSEAGLPLIPVIAVAGAAAAIVAFFLLRRKPREEAPRPAALRITVDPTELLADGRSSSTITIELLDKDGKPMKAPQNTEVRLSASKGRVVSPVTIGEGQTSVAAKLVSSMEVGEVRVATAARGLEGTSTTLTFVEKKRYCMHCGTRMPVDVNRCPRCGREPPSGVDVKACPNCGEVIPKVAGFCSACGASQPEDPSNDV